MPLPTTMSDIQLTEHHTLVRGLEQEHGAKLAAIERYRRAANYLSAAQIYLRDNVLLRAPLRPEHIKDRLLGHWGTCPGINLIYAHLNRLIREHSADMLLVTGPGHGAAANLANLYLEGSLGEYYPEFTQDAAGLQRFVRAFCWPSGLPSHLSPAIPGTIHEGGELGYALSTAFGAVMDNPDLIAACIVGDGEAETGPTAAAWHSYKFIDPAESGAVLPILHLNRYKISNPTILGSMRDIDLLNLFSGYGYLPRIVSDMDLDADMWLAMDWAYAEIRTIQNAARTGNRIAQPEWPLLILRSPKGWTGIRYAAGHRIEGTSRAHQVPANDLKTNPESLALVEDWLRSYRPDELFDEHGQPAADILAQCPDPRARMGTNPHTFGGRMRRALALHPIDKYAIPIGTEEAERGKTYASSVEQLALLLQDVIVYNPQRFRIFSPDELESNKLGSLLTVTHRNYQWPVAECDTNIGPDGGRVLEILSEHTCQGWLQGYLLTGRHGLFPSYESFLPIVSTMMDQFAKFLKISAEIPWRLPVPSLNYLETSTLWRQEHNGFSHQSPAFINAILNKKAKHMRVYLPPDANCLISTMDHCLRSKDKVNLVVATKQPAPQWLSMDEAIAHCRAGASVWTWASTDDGLEPDVVLVGIGDNPTVEVMAAAKLLRTEVPELRVRVVNVTDLLVLEKDSAHPHGLDAEMFNAMFTVDRPVIFNFHGYPSAVKQLLFGRENQARFQVNGYQEEGTTTTPFDMSIRNGTSRFHLAMQAVQAAVVNPEVAVVAADRVKRFEESLAKAKRYILENGKDPEEIANWKWS